MIDAFFKGYNETDNFNVLCIMKEKKKRKEA